MLLEDGISYVREGAWIGNDPGGPESMADVPGRLVDGVIAAADGCPGECIFIEIEQTPG